MLIYASKTWENITFREELEALKDPLDLTIVHVLREPPDDWDGETGYVDQELLEKYIPTHAGGRQYFICASPKMMDGVESAFYEFNVPITHVHQEHFNLV